MLHEIDLRALADKRGPERAFLSLYVGDPDWLRSLDGRAARVRAMLEEEPAELEHFDQSLAMAREAAEQLDLSGGGGVVFACWALDLVEAHPLTVEVPSFLWVGASPYIRPLAERQDEYEQFVVVAADNEYARVFLVASAVPEETDRVRGDVKNHVKKGGWSQKRYQRRRDNELLHYAKEVAEHLQALEREVDFSRIVLLGSNEALVEIHEALPEPLAAKVVGERTVSLDEEDDTLLETAFELFFDQERRDERQMFSRIKSEYMSHGLAAAGPEEVLEAALVGRVDTLLLRRDVELAGTRCRDCSNVFAGRRDRCPACRSDSLFVVDLVNELVEAVERTDAKVDFTDPIPGLDTLGGVVALLRW